MTSEPAGSRQTDDVSAVTPTEQVAAAEALADDAGLDPEAPADGPDVDPEAPADAPQIDPDAPADPTEPEPDLELGEP
jgi:hypothetical protein